MVSCTKNSLSAVQRWPLKLKAPQHRLPHGYVEVGVGHDDAHVLGVEPENGAQAVGLGVQLFE
jgi:hypothetical protein